MRSIPLRLIFSLENSKNHTMLQELIDNIPLEYFLLSEEIIQYAKSFLGKRLSDTIHVSIVDHLYTGIERAKEGIIVKNPLLWDIQRFYHDEFQIGLHTLELVRNQFHINLPKDEAGFIALHFVNAQLDETIQEIYRLTQVMQEITNIVKHHFHVNFDEESVYYYRFVTHLKFFSQRLINGNTFESTEENELLELIKSKYHNSYSCIVKIKKFLLDNYDYTVSEEEELYLTIHVERLIYKTT